MAMIQLTATITAKVKMTKTKGAVAIAKPIKKARSSGRRDWRVVWLAVGYLGNGARRR